MTCVSIIWPVQVSYLIRPKELTSQEHCTLSFSALLWQQT
jgi:hypothetical protein